MTCQSAGWRIIDLSVPQLREWSEDLSIPQLREWTVDVRRSHGQLAEEPSNISPSPPAGGGGLGWGLSQAPRSYQTLRRFTRPLSLRKTDLRSFAYTEWTQGLRPSHFYASGIRAQNRWSSVLRSVILILQETGTHFMRPLNAN